MHEPSPHLSDASTVTTSMDGPLGVFERLKYVNRVKQAIREPLALPALVHLAEDGSALVHELDGEKTFGRGGQASVTLASTKMSSLHFRLVPGQDQMWRMEDLNSKNGTFRNGERLTRPISIVWGDIIEAGELAFVLLPPALQHRA